MGLFNSVLGSFIGNNPQAGPLQSVLGSIMSGSQQGQQGGQPGLVGLVNSFQQAGLGHLVGSWIGNGQNQPVSPGQLQQVFGNQQVEQWAQQSGMPAGALLGQLAQFLPHAVDHATPNGEIPQLAGPDAAGSDPSPFDDAGTELPSRTRQV